MHTKTSQGRIAVSAKIRETLILRDRFSAFTGRVQTEHLTAFGAHTHYCKCDESARCLRMRKKI